MWLEYWLYSTIVVLPYAHEGVGEVRMSGWHDRNLREKEEEGGGGVNILLHVYIFGKFINMLSQCWRGTGVWCIHSIQQMFI